MLEQMNYVSHYAELHLFFSSIVCLSAWLLTSVVRRGANTLKYWICVATSLNFILPIDATLSRFWPWRGLPGLRFSIASMGCAVWSVIVAPSWLGAFVDQ
jgi:hypothetical protein